MTALGFAAGFAAGGFLFYWLGVRRNGGLQSDLARFTERSAGLEQRAAEAQLTTEKLKNEFKLAAMEVIQDAKADSGQAIEADKTAISVSVKDMKERLEKYAKKVEDFENERHQLYGEIKQSVKGVLDVGNSLRMETAALKRVMTASSGVQGLWGQTVLQEILEQNNLVRGLHFDSQVSIPGESSDNRPDFVIRLPGERRLAIDCKHVVGEYILAQETDDPARQREHFEKLVQNIRTNFIKLSRKEYQASLDPEVPYVIMFIPSEPASRAAFATDPELFREASDRRVILSSPMTIIPLIHLIKHAWQQEKLAANARELGAVVEELGNRLSVFVGHLKGLRDGIQKTAEGWDKAYGSWEKKVEPQLDKVKNLGGKLKDADELSAVDAKLRPVEPNKALSAEGARPA